MRKGVCNFLLALCLSVPMAASAQYDNGSIVGTAKDRSGAVLAGATVTVTNIATGLVSTQTTRSSGEYEIPNLRVGQYNVVISEAGFSNATATNISVTVGGRQRIDLVLEVGSSTTTVEVSGVALQIETETSERGQTITGYQTAALPLVSRNYSDLLGLVTGSRQAPTSATTSSINSLTRAGSYNINGERSMFNNFLLDGLDNNAYGESNQGFDNQIIAVPPDSVAQFQVVTNNESAEYGRSSGATINVASNSGTNKFHATAYEFLRNTDLNANGFFKPTQTGSSGIVVPFKKPTFNRNQYGINFGGPLVRDKLFFFLDYEGFRQVLKPLSVLTLPTQNELNGVLVVPVRNPLTGKSLPGRVNHPCVRYQPHLAADHRCLSQRSYLGCVRRSHHRAGSVQLRGAGALHRSFRQGRSSPRLPAESFHFLVSSRKRSQRKRGKLRCSAAAPGRTNQRSYPSLGSAGRRRVYAAVWRRQGA